MNYVKTYELFGLFGKKKGTSRNVKSFLAHEKDEKSKRDKYEDDQRVASENHKATKERFNNRIASTIKSISHPSIDDIRVDTSDGKISLIIRLNSGYLNDVIGSFRSQNGLSFKSVDARNASLDMEFRIESDYNKPMYMSRNKDWSGIFHSTHSDELSLWMRNILDYKGNVSDDIHRKRIEIGNSMMRRAFPSERNPEISFETGQTDDVDLSGLKNTIISKAAEMGRWICYDIVNKIKHFEKLREFEVISSFTDDEVKDYLSDVIDISNDYVITRSDESIHIKLEIPGLRNYDGKMRMTKLNSQVIKYLTEIQGRLEERELEIDIRFDPDFLGILITKMENVKHEEIKPRPSNSYDDDGD